MISPFKLAKILQNRSTSIKAATHVSAIQDNIEQEGGKCFYVHDDDGAILRVVVTTYKQGLR